MKGGKILRAAVLLGTALTLCLAQPALAANKKHAKGPAKEGGLFVAPAPLGHAPTVLDSFVKEPREVKVEYTTDPDPVPVAAPVVAEVVKEPSYGVAALRIHSLFE